MSKGSRVELLSELARSIQAFKITHPLRVAVDGASAVGKTTLADELGVVLRERGREVIRASIEDFLLSVCSAIGAANTRPKAVITTASRMTRCIGSCSIR
jgi:pantothenate kinase-related protein Tda10